MQIQSFSPGFAPTPRPNPVRHRQSGAQLPQTSGTVRFGLTPDAIIGMVVVSLMSVGVGGIITLTAMCESKWGKTLTELDKILDELKKENAEITQRPVIKEKDGKIGKRYQIRIGNQEFVVTEFREAKQKSDSGFYSQPRDILTSFRMEKVSTNANEPKVKLKYVASVNGPDAKTPKKHVTYIDKFGVYETEKAKGQVIKRTESIIQALQTLDGEQRVAHFFENNRPVTNEEALEDAFFAEDQDQPTAKGAAKSLKANL